MFYEPLRFPGFWKGFKFNLERKKLEEVSKNINCTGYESDEEYVP